MDYIKLNAKVLTSATAMTLGRGISSLPAIACAGLSPKHPSRMQLSLVSPRRAVEIDLATFPCSVVVCLRDFIYFISIVVILPKLNV